MSAPKFQGSIASATRSCTWGLHKSYDIAAIARPYIERLKILFNETIQLQVLSENQCGIYIIVEECEDPLRVTFP